MGTLSKGFSEENYFVLLFSFCSYQADSRMNKLTKTNCKEPLVCFLCGSLLEDGGFGVCEYVFVCWLLVLYFLIPSHKGGNQFLSLLSSDECKRARSRS